MSDRIEREAVVEDRILMVMSELHDVMSVEDRTEVRQYMYEADYDMAVRILLTILIEIMARVSDQANEVVDIGREVRRIDNPMEGK